MALARDSGATRPPDGLSAAQRPRAERRSKAVKNMISRQNCVRLSQLSGGHGGTGPGAGWCQMGRIPMSRYICMRIDAPEPGPAEE